MSETGFGHEQSPVVDRPPIIQWPGAEDVPAPAGPHAGRGGSGRDERLALQSYVPHFIERLSLVAESGLSFADPQVTLFVPREDFLAFALGHRIETPAALAVARNEQTYEAAVERGVLGRMWDYLRQFIPVSEVKRTREYVPIAEVHCPWRAECEAAYTSTRTEKRTVDLDVHIRGVHAGAGFETTVTAGDEFKLKQGCRLVLAPVWYRTVEWRHPLLGRSLRIVSVDEIVNDLQVADIPADGGHACRNDYAIAAQAIAPFAEKGILRQGRDYVEPGLGGTSGTAGQVKTRTVERSRKFTMSGGERFGIHVESQFTRDTTYAYTLADRGRYLGHYASRTSEVFYWHWTD